MILNKKVLLIPCFLIAGILFTHFGSRRVEKYNSDKAGQEQITVLNESTVSSNDSNIEDESLIGKSNNNEEYYKSVLLRLIHDDIAIVDAEEKYYFSDVFSSYYIKMLSDSKFYIFDINGDRISDIGICFPTNVLVAYCYHPETDTLSSLVDTGMYTEILGNGQIMTVAQTSTRLSYQYQLIDSLGDVVTMISFDKDYIGKEEADFLYSIRFMVNAKSDMKDPNYKNSMIEITKEQWDSLIEPLMVLRKNAPKPLKYEDLEDNTHS